MWDTNQRRSPQQGSMDFSSRSSSFVDEPYAVAQINTPKRLSQHLVSDPLIQLYYQHFHHAHPLLLPLSVLGGPTGQQIPAKTLTVMRYVGAHYHRDPSVQETLKEDALSMLSSTRSARDGFQVQCMLMLAICAHAHGEEDRAYQILQLTIDLALDLGMHSDAFATAHGAGSCLLEEMWRRTYWELYVVEALLSALREQSTFSLFHIQSDVHLPCDDHLYNGGAETLPQGYPLMDLRDNWPLGPQRCNFSSFAYRVDAVRLLGAVLALNPSSEQEIDPDALEPVDDALTEWVNNFPMREDEILGDNGYFDEMIFQARMIVDSAIIYLYRPRSAFARIPFDSRIACSVYPTVLQFSSFDILDPYTTKLVQAADRLSNLLTLPSPVKRHSPFLIHGLFMSVLVHTAACVMSNSPQSEESFKVRVQLAVGVLNRVSESWPLASGVKQQLLTIYRETMHRFR